LTNEQSIEDSQSQQISEFTLGEKVKNTLHERKELLSSLSELKMRYNGDDQESTQKSVDQPLQTDDEGGEFISNPNAAMIQALQYQIAARSKKLEIDVNAPDDDVDDKDLKFEPPQARKSEAGSTPPRESQIQDQFEEEKHIPNATTNKK
jgi:D-alanyl-D-alanine carboxypeptidase